MPCDRPPRARAGQLFGRDAQLADLVQRLRARDDVCVWGPAGFGKTALAAEAIRSLLPDGAADLSRSPFPDGIVLLDLYRLKADADKVWHLLADKFVPTLPTTLPARDRATQACATRLALVVVEGAEEAGRGQDLQHLLSVLDGTVTRLILTRDKEQVFLAHPIQLDAELPTLDAVNLLRTLAGPAVAGEVLVGVVDALGGHPLALTWTGIQLALKEEPAAQFLRALRHERLPGIHEPGYEDHTVKWLYDRTVRRLDEDGRRVLAAAAVLAAAPFAVGAAKAALGPGRAEPPTDDAKTESRARAALKQLVRHGLLRVASGVAEEWEFTHALASRFAAAESDGHEIPLAALSQWVLDAFAAGAAQVRQTGDFSPIQLISLHAASLLHCDTTTQATGQLANWMLYDGQDLFIALGRLESAHALLRAVAAWMGRQPPDQRTGSRSQRERSVLLNRLGDVQLAQGDLDTARVSYEQGRQIAAKLAAADPANARWQRDLSASLNNLGNVQLAQDDLATARVSYEQSRQIRAKLAAVDPSNAGWQRDLSVSLEKLGDVQLAQGDLAAAHVSYEQGRQIRAKLVAADPSNAGWQRDLSVSLKKLGDVQLTQVDLAAARVSYEQSRQILAKLAAADPSNAGWQRDVLVSLGSLGDVAAKTGDHATARREFAAGLSIAERLTKLDPTNATWHNDAVRLRDRLEKLPPGW